MAASPRARRWWKIAAVAAILFAVLAWWVNRQLEPNRLTALVLERAGKTLQLDISFSGQPDYALRPEPRLRVPKLSVRAPGGKEFLFAERAEISLPWATITGGDPVITRVALDRPRLDLAGLLAWLASRPKAPFELPTLNRGLEIHDGALQGDGYRLEAVELELPYLKSAEPAALQARGRFLRPGTTLDFETQTTVEKASAESGFTLDAKLLLANTPKALHAKLQTRGKFKLADASNSLALDTIALESDSPLPSLNGHGKLSLDEQLRLELAATLRRWPADWPALPSPLAENSEGLPLSLIYAGDTQLTTPMALHIARADTVLDAKLRLPDLLDWMDRPPGSPIPPLAGTLKTPKLEIGGAQLEGVEIEIGSDQPAPP